jgi:hypothetical protein
MQCLPKSEDKAPLLLWTRAYSALPGRARVEIMSSLQKPITRVYRKETLRNLTLISSVHAAESEFGVGWTMRH